MRHVLGITWESGTWWYGYSWHLVHARYSCSIINLVEKMTRHGANMGKINGRNSESVHWVPLPMYKVWWCLFTWCMSLCDMSYWWAHSTYILLYYTTPGMVPARVHRCFFTSSFQITIPIYWYARISCGMGRSHFRVLEPNWHI